MKILVAMPVLPWPLDAGGNVANCNSLACLQDDHEFTLVCPVYGEEGEGRAAALQSHLPKVRVRAVNCGGKAPRKRSRREIVLDILRRSARKCFRVAPSGPAADVELKEDSPSYVFYPLPEKFVSAVMAELSQGFDLVQLEYAEMLSLGGSLPPDIPKLFVHLQIHSVYCERFAAVRKCGAYTGYLSRMIEIQEEAYLKTFDGVIVYSDFDKGWLRKWIPDNKLFVSPFPIDGVPAENDDSGAAAHFSFAGAEMHFPNVDGLEWLTTEVWPEILKEMPGATLKVIGKWSESAKARLSAPGVVFSGFVPDFLDALKGRIMLVPIRIGSGIRVKVLESLFNGITVVSTSIGCEGIPAADGTEILIRDDAKKFADAAVQLATDGELRARLRAAGKDLITRVYSPGVVRRQRNELYRNLLLRKQESAGIAAGIHLSNSGG